MASTNQQGVVGELAVAHLDAAYNLARWLLGNEADATDAVQDAFVRALRSAHTYAGDNAKAWWLAIVRNDCCRIPESTTSNIERRRPRKARSCTTSCGVCRPSFARYWCCARSRNCPTARSPMRWASPSGR